MSYLTYIYKTKTLANNGFFLLVAIATALISGYFFIPTFKPSEPEKQLITLNGLALKYDDSQAVSYFIQSIKKQHGYLCLGTSESGDLPNGNYWSFLNNDSSVTPNFSTLSGAGRTCGVYIPLLLNHRIELKGLYVIYFINPVYWRTDLADVNLEYWNRYSNYKVASGLHLTKQEIEKYCTSVNAYLDKQPFISAQVAIVEYGIRAMRKKYFYDLRYMLNASSFTNDMNFISANKSGLQAFKNFGKIDTESIDTVWNIARNFHNKEWFHSIDLTNTYRYNELQNFINVCKDLGVETTFILGPVNKRFIEEYDPNSLDAYRKTTENIEQLLISTKSNYINATDISSKAGAFIDHQHHSSYGAYLLYKKIKNYIDENNAH